MVAHPLLEGVMARPRKGHEKLAANKVMFRITDEARAGLERMKVRNGTDIADEARQAIDEYLIRNGELAHAGPPRVPREPASVPQVPPQAEPKKSSVFGNIARKG
jgi:hypothetical protein